MKRLSSPERKRRFRQRLFEQQKGRCHWCGVEMTWPVHIKGKSHPPTTVSIDHLDSRLSQQRGAFPGQARRVLACIECNNRRAAEEQAALPKVELWRRSGSFPTGELVR